MNRTVVSGFAAFALLIGAGLAMTETTAEAGRCGGGLLSGLKAKSCGGKVLGNLDLGKKSCGGGLLARLKAKHASDCCAPEAVPCEAPAPCEPVPCEAVTDDCCADDCCSKPGLLKRLMSKLRSKKSCCDDPCAAVEEAASSSDSAEEAAPPAPVADAKTDA